MRQNKRFFKKKDYKKKKYRNPFFAEKRKRKQARQYIWQTLKISLLFLLLAATGWWLFYSPYFNITTIKINGNIKAISQNIKNLTAQRLSQKKFLFLPAENIFLFDASSLKKELAGLYFFSRLTVQKKYPHTLVIAYQQKKPALVWLEGGQYYFLDEQGHILTKPRLNQEEKIILIENTAEPKIKNQSLQLTKEQISFLVKLSAALVNYKPMPSFSIDRLRVGPSPYTVILVLKQGPLIYFNIRLSAQMQLKKLSLAIKEKIKDDFLKKQYIDLRYGDMIYLK